MLFLLYVLIWNSKEVFLLNFYKTPCIEAFFIIFVSSNCSTFFVNLDVHRQGQLCKFVRRFIGIFLKNFTINRPIFYNDPIILTVSLIRAGICRISHCLWSFSVVKLARAGRCASRDGWGNLFSSKIQWSFYRLFYFLKQ